MDIINHDGKTTIVLEGDLTSEDLNLFKEAVQQEIKNGQRTISIDFSNTVVVDSMGIGCLVATYNTLKTIDGALILTNMPDNLKDIFHTMRLDRIFTIE